MQSRRKLLLIITACCVAMCFVVASVLADELLGVLTKVDVDGKKITVVEKDTEKEIEVKITDETEQVSKKGNAKSTSRSSKPRSRRLRTPERKSTSR